MSDVWDLTDKDKGDHVLIALTVEECRALLNPRVRASTAQQGLASGLHEIRLALRDQKNIEV